MTHILFFIIWMSSRVAIQPGFLHYQVDNTFTWEATFYGEKPLVCGPRGVGLDTAA